MKKILLVMFFALMFVFPLLSFSIEREGYGNTLDEAHTNAAAEVSKFLYSNVDARTVTALRDSMGSVEASYFSGTEIRSQMPLLGLSYRDRKENGGYISTASMDSVVSLPLYYESIDSIIGSLVMPNLDGVESIEAARLLNEVLNGFEEYRKLSYVVTALKGSYSNAPQTTEAEIRTALSRLNGIVDSLEKAALILTEECSFNDIFVEMPMPAVDSVASDFSVVFSNAIGKGLAGRTVRNMKDASYYLSSRYAEERNGDLFVVSNLSDINGRNVFTSSVTIPAALVDGMRIYADGYDFRKALSTGETVSNAFNVYMRINGGSQGGVFHDGEELFVEVKASRPCYYYVVGYVFNDGGEKFSYLFPISIQEDGKDMFVGRIGPENVGKWIVINPSYMDEVFPLEIMAPYGVETLQIYASTTNDYMSFLSRIPAFKETEDFYLITGEPEHVLSSTRALNVKKMASGKKGDYSSEANVTYRSVR